MHFLDFVSIYFVLIIEIQNISSRSTSDNVQICSHCFLTMLIFNWRNCNREPSEMRARVCVSSRRHVMPSLFLLWNSFNHTQTYTYKHTHWTLTFIKYLQYIHTVRLPLVHSPQFLHAFNGDFQFNNSIFVLLFKIKINRIHEK